MRLTKPAKPSPHYALIAQACRECGFDIKDDDYELIDSMPHDGMVEEGPKVDLMIGPPTLMN